MRYVIIGMGPAGVIAAETLRKHNRQAQITLIGAEMEPPYSRMAIPYLLMENINEQGTYLRKQTGHFEKLQIDLLYGRVVALDSSRKQLHLDEGKIIHYDKCLIATGSHPVKPPINGIDLPEVANCWTLADARRITEKVHPGSRVILMGAGFIGCIILEALVKRGAQLTVIERGDRMVPRMMNEKAGNLIKKWCLNKGIKVLTSTCVMEISQSPNAGLKVLLDNDESLEADMLIAATGVKANISFLENSGIATDQGILINRHMQTNLPDIFAAGDVAQGLDFSTGESTVQAIQPTAADHAQIAAKNMLGFDSAIHQGSINMNILDTLGLISSSFGLWQGISGGESAELYNPEQYQYINLQFDQDVLVGATTLGMTQHVGVLRGLIQNKTHLGGWKETLKKDPTRVMDAWLATHQVLN
jgi:NAD(P)H-nitrite reductase large subunit